MWVWDAAPLFGDAGRQALLALCAGQGINTVWVQVGVGHGARLDRPADWQRLLTAAHTAGIRVHALDGAPELILRERHADVMNVVQAVIAFNREAPAPARFDGIHLDNEPYLLAGWHDPATREQLLEQFLALNARVDAAVRQAGGLEFGVDIPFWWQSRDAATGEAIGVVTFRGQRKAASYHLIDLVDNVGIMNYRNVAEGPDGLIVHAQELLAYADRGRARIFVGVETSRISDAGYWFLTGVTRAALRRALGRTVAPDARDLTIVDAGAHVLIGIRTSGEAADEARLAAFARQLDAAVLDADGRRLLATARAALAEEGEWRALAPVPVVDAEGRAHGGLRASRVMLPKLTFAGRTTAEMVRELGIADAAFRAHRSYVGIAIHHYESYRARFTQGPPPQFEPNR